jgi:uncharacterized protein (DUF1501 family)
MDRRHFLMALSATMAAIASPTRVARADAASGRRFVFVFADGGWDPLCVFAPLFGKREIEPDAGSAPMTVSGFDLVDHPDRPSVRAFFERWGKRAVLVNGINVRSVSHDVCKQIALTGRSSDAEPDWASRLAGAELGSFALPHLSLSGPVLPGGLGAAVARIGTAGQLAGLVRGSFLDKLDTPPRRFGDAAERVLDRYYARRVAGFRARHRGASAAEDRLLDDLEQASDRTSAVKQVRDELSLDPGNDALSQAGAAVAALAQGLSRCVSLGTGVMWDTHVDNDAQQGAHFSALFQMLDALCSNLATTAGPSGAPLAEDTVVVVLSEMARTPKRNGNGGRDHWPFTSALLVGPGLDGGRTVGGYDDHYAGTGVDFASGEPDTKASSLTMADLGATLLALGGVERAHGDGTPVKGVLA